MRIRPEQANALRAAALERFRRERLLALRDKGVSVEEIGSGGDLLVRDAAGGSARVVSRGTRASVTSAEGRTLVTDQYERGRIRSITDPAGQEVRFERDEQGLLTAIDRGEGGRYRFSHRADGKLLSIEYPDGTATQTEYSPEGRPAVVTRRDGTRVRYEYSPDGLVTGVADPLGHRTAFVYDEWDTPRAIEYPNGLRHEFEYDARGYLRRFLAGGEERARYAVDEAAGTHEVQYADGTWVRYRVQGDRIVEASNETATVRFEYDGAGRLVREETGGQIVRYLRNGVGAMTGLVTPTGEQITFTRDRDQRLVGITDWMQGRYELTVGPTGPPARIRYPNGVTTDVTTTAMGLPASWTVTGAGPGHRLLDACRWEYDTCDRLVSATRGQIRRAYRYDPAGRLVAVEGAGPLDEQFELDASGNRLRDPGGACAYDGANQLLRRGTQPFAYDALGNTIAGSGARGPVEYRYNGRGQLVEAGTQHGVARYAYDAVGRRIRKEVGGRVTRYIWAGTQLLAELISEGAETIRRDYLVCPDRPGPLAMRHESTVYYLHGGRLDEPMCMTDRRGEVVWQAEYRAFGEAVVSIDAVPQPWRLAGHYFDEETGLHYTVARYLAPELGRFLTMDPLRAEGGSLNFYAYCDGDPVNRLDPTGEIGLSLGMVVGAIVVGAAVGAIIGGGIEAYRQSQQGQYDGWKIAKAAAIGGLIGAIGGAVGVVVEGAVGLVAGAIVAGAVAGAVAAGVEYCAEVALTDTKWSWGDFGRSVGIGLVVGAVTAGVGGVLAARAARRAAREAAEKAAQEAAERAAREAAEREAREAAERAAREAATRFSPEVENIARKTGWSAEDVAAVEKHWLKDEHILVDDATGAIRKGRFDVDEHSKGIWDKAARGEELTPEETAYLKKLLQHEKREADILRQRSDALDQAFREGKVEEMLTQDLKKLGKSDDEIRRLLELEPKPMTPYRYSHIMAHYTGGPNP
jgi:RHS repeat-associated protein